MNSIVVQDIELIFQGLSPQEREKLKGSTVLITGCAGFLGLYFVAFFSRYQKELQIKRLIGLDNFLTGSRSVLQQWSHSDRFEFHSFDVIHDDINVISGAAEADYVLHMASVASPTFYRQYPIETLDANVWGLRRLLDFYCDKPLKSFAFFSSSEIYGDPDPKNIPTSEDYRGHVACIGPRSCYDEAKRFGETLCYLFHQKYQMPIRIIRPFNNFGPGMKLNDRRVPADFTKAVIENQDIVIYSDGSPTRTFCYVSDAVTGFLKVLLYDRFDYFNIGSDFGELSILELAQIYQRVGREIFGYSGNLVFYQSEDKDYLTDNPNRRCPSLTKARNLLGFNPRIDVETGVRRLMEHIRQSKVDDLIW